MSLRITRGTGAVTRGSAALKVMAVPEQYPRSVRAAYRSDQSSRRILGGMVVRSFTKVHTLTTALPKQKPPRSAELAGVYTTMALAEQRNVNQWWTFI